MEKIFLKGKRICEKRPKGFSNGREDRISKLPDSLISRILLDLPTKEAIRTSSLSQRWYRPWLLLPGLDLDTSEFPDYNAFVGFMDKFLDSSREAMTCLQSLKLTIRKDENDPPCLARWVDFVAKSKLKHLNVEFLHMKRKCLEVMPLSLYVCETLVYLKLRRIFLGKFESISLPHLKTMSLELNEYASEACLESLISSCHVLEDLNIVRRVHEDFNTIRVLSHTLTSLNIEFYASADYEDEEEAYEYEVEHKDKVEDEVEDSENLRGLIDAPKLKYLSVEYDMPAKITIRHLGSLTKIHLFGIFEFEDAIDTGLEKQFFAGIKDVRAMKFSWEAFQYIQKIKQLPQFCNMSSLEVEFYLDSVGSLPIALEIFPNLKFLILELHNFIEMKQITLSSVPRCLLSSLEVVEIKNRYCNDPNVIQVARYFLKNSLNLKKFVLRFEGDMPEADFIILRDDLLAYPRRSSICQVEIC